MDESRAIIFLAVIAACWLGWQAYTEYAPANYDITEPLDLTENPTFVTDWKLRIASPAACFAALGRAGIEFQRLPDEKKGEGCGFRDVATLERSLVSWGGRVTLTCQTLASLVVWERHALLPAAERILGSPVVRIRHFGTYSCRNVNNAARGRRSEHATANAIDVAGFTLENGEEVSVLADWSGEGPKAEFLREIRDEACDRFNVVLGPEYNALHRDHFHFDNGGFMICR